MQTEQEMDVTLVLRDGKKISVSGKELSAASDFFSTLQNTDMKERREGVIRLEHFNENVMRDVLEFMRSGSVNITHENAQDLIEAADYFILPGLKRAAGSFLRRTLQPSNCISIYYFPERYQCEDLVVTSREFIFANFAAVAKSKEFLHLKRQEVEKWISRHEIVVSSEDVVFRIILKWIEQRKTERRGKFLELFRHVRLPFVSRGFLKEYVATNNFVKESSSCLKHVKDALKGIFPQTEYRQQSPRNWSDSHLVIFTGMEALCYDPVKDKWYQLWKAPASYLGPGWDYPKLSQLADKLPEPLSQNLRKNISCHQARKCTLNQIHGMPGEETGFINEGACAVSMGDYLYVLGGILKRQARRFDTVENKWERIADMYQEKTNACGVAAHGKIFVAGGAVINCEMYDVSDNQWHRVALSLNTRRFGIKSMVCLNGQLYIVNAGVSRFRPFAAIESYDIKTTRWKIKTKVQISFLRNYWRSASPSVYLEACSLNISRDLFFTPIRGMGLLAFLRYEMGLCFPH